MYRRERGFTLVELLVVIAIIGVLVGLLMPAIMAAKEGGRRTTCSSQVANLAKACIGHLSKAQFFPSGGWGSSWVGSPDRGFGANQPGGWIYNILPFLDNDALHDLGKGTSTGLARGYSATRVQNAVQVLYCPSRRRPEAYPAAFGSYIDTNPVKTVARTDYAINGGSVYVAHGKGPGSDSAAAKYPWPNFSAKGFNGLSCVRSQISEAAVASYDGLSNTYLVGEKYVCPDDYVTGTDKGDLYCAYSGDDFSLVRWASTTNAISTAVSPMQDTSGVVNTHAFGSAHSAGWHAAMCDGSVKLLSFNLDPQTHQCLASRNDGLPVDPKKVR